MLQMCYRPPFRRLRPPSVRGVGHVRTRTENTRVAGSIPAETATLVPATSSSASLSRVAAEPGASVAHPPSGPVGALPPGRGGEAPRPVAEHCRHDEPVHRPNRDEVRAAEHSMEPDERRDNAKALASIVEDANRDAEVEVPVIEAEQDFVLCRREHGKDADAFAGTICYSGSVFEGGPRGDGGPALCPGGAALRARRRSQRTRHSERRRDRPRRRRSLPRRNGYWPRRHRNWRAATSSRLASPWAAADPVLQRARPLGIASAGAPCTGEGGARSGTSGAGHRCRPSPLFSRSPVERAIA